MGAGVRDAFPPPMCVWIVYAFRLGGLCVNGYFVCVRLRGKILRSVVGAVPMCPPASPCKGASIVIPAHNACIFVMETPLRGRSGGHIGTAPTVSFGADCTWVVLFVGKTVHMNQHHRCCTFVSPGLIEHSEIYPGESRGGEPMPSALYFLKSIFMCGNHSRIILSPRMVMMCDEKKYNPQGGSLLACIVTQGRLRCTCQPCAIESITPMG